jgi:integrase
MVSSTAESRKRRPRRRGSGGVFFVREGVWRVDVEIARDPVTGRRRRVSRYVHGTREDADVALARLKVADHEKRLPTGVTNARSVRAAFQLYQQAVDVGLVELAPRTRVTVRSAANTMSSTELADGRVFGDIRLARLTWQDIEALYSAMRAAGAGALWARRCATVLTRTLELARKRGLLDANPAKDAARPHLTRTKPFAPKGDEVLGLLSQVRKLDPELADMVTLLASTGMRVGELLGLCWEDVDIAGQELHVAWSLTDGGPGFGVQRKPTKRADWRDVPLTGAAVTAVQAQRARLRQLLQGEPAGDAYVFPGANPSVPMRPERLLNRWLAARGPSPVTLGHFRHYAATTMLDSGQSYRTVGDILGNSESTLRLHYDGRTDVGKRKAIAALELGPPPDEAS